MPRSMQPPGWELAVRYDERYLLDAIHCHLLCVRTYRYYERRTRKYGPFHFPKQYAKLARDHQAYALWLKHRLP